MRVRDAIRKNPQMLPSSATVGDAARLMDEAGVGAVIVADEGVPVGIVTDRDLVLRALAREVPPDARLDAVMSLGVVCIDADRDLHDAVLLFSTYPFRRLPVVAGHVVIGMITVDDLLVDLIGDLANVTRGLTAQVLFGHAEPRPPVPA
jgi:signal-transduction protein with cAMP-binding, CBS, and nucleotidyltransferase domain